MKYMLFAIALFVSFIGGAAIAATNTPTLPQRVTILEKKVKTLTNQVSEIQGQILQIERRQETASEAFDLRVQEVDLTNAGVACLASWTAQRPTDDLGSCNLLKLKSSPPYPPDFFGLIVALAKAAGH